MLYSIVERRSSSKLYNANKPKKTMIDIFPPKRGCRECKKNVLDYRSYLG